jgi:multidrug efflux pump subunit AcrA (membrane-fusion protein)
MIVFDGAAIRGKSALPWAAVLIAVLTSSAGCNSKGSVAAEQPVPRVTVAEVIGQEIVDSDEYTGKTEASEIVEVRARVFGFLKTIDFKDGDFVHEGQTLFTIEPDEYEAIHQQSLARIALNTANYELAKTKLARNEKLVPPGQFRGSMRDGRCSTRAGRRTASTADANRCRGRNTPRGPISGRVDRALRRDLLTGGMSGDAADDHRQRATDVRLL